MLYSVIYSNKKKGGVKMTNAIYMREYRRKKREEKQKKIFVLRVKSSDDGYLYFNDLNLADLECILGFLKGKDTELSQKQ